MSASEVLPLFKGITFNGRIADKAFDKNAIVAEPNDGGVKVDSQHPGRARKLSKS